MKIECQTKLKKNNSNNKSIDVLDLEGQVLSPRWKMKIECQTKLKKNNSNNKSIDVLDLELKPPPPPPRDMDPTLYPIGFL